MKAKWYYLFFVILYAICTACTPTVDSIAATSSPETPQEQKTSEPIQTDQPAATELPAVAPDPQVITFTTSDGQTLTGTYYPASVNPAPVIVLMHWMGGSEHDWDAVAVWLQNRGVDSGITNPAQPWQDSSWFPQLPEGFSIGVFTFSFRGCENGYECNTTDRPGWLLDAQAAVQTAAGLEGADPARIITAGASIGADGAADGCYMVNEIIPGTCKGSFSLSPDGYLTVAYPLAVEKMQTPESGNAIPAWCLADQSEIFACKMAKGDTYRLIEVQNGGHGMDMIKPGLDPQALELLIEFIQLTVLP
jgi:hypothetical protein